ncbi:unnamed protein product [Vitrella brassicaformis CCMP3155]|uniref:BTB domain-containing protein n=2 Tax=Vitrella brassicaformis TaxID=1169539 RepID=A0A0G4ED92_VITBC|nr:unnamed protein product [Vitrella brassicaformis CCMP3155]|mmetsp:Transcript_36877/g.92460  ORF Transcript_36877/g.92460 Transcript_36877/m.92460 type:complete len:501 (+) Transcript_36877:114-1616(+)|eukprot:CEL93311.1 unnamed protein product [Vitrella brassicaformis CCMP3155]
MAHFWTTPSTNSCPGPRAAHSCDVLEGKLYVFGGWNGKKALNDLHVLDVAKGEWHEVVPNRNAPAERNNHTTAVVGSKLFVHGGHDGSKWLQDLHVLDTSTAQRGKLDELAWVRPAASGSAPSARACHTLTRVGRKLYMFGGYDGTKCFNDMDVLDLDTMTWIQPNLTGTIPQARNAHTMTVITTKLYLFGGHSGNKHLTDLHVFDTTKLMWAQPEIQGTPPPGLRGHTANLIGHKIFLFGGYDGKGRSNDLYILDTALMRWIHPAESENAPTGRQRHSASLIGSKKLYIFGGFDGNKWLNDLHVLDIGRLEEDALNDVAVRNLIDNMRKLVNNSEFSDITIVVENREIHAHKAILVAQCEHFRAMFTTQMKESFESKVIIPEWSYNSFMAMLEFLYTGRITDLSTDITGELLGLADHYTLDGLKQLCENILIHSVEIDNVCNLLKQADQYQATDLKNHCLTYLIKNFDAVSKTTSFEDLKEKPSLLLEVTKQMASANHK